MRWLQERLRNMFLISRILQPLEQRDVLSLHILERLQQSLKTTAQLWLSVRFVTTWRMVILPILSIIRTATWEHVPQPAILHKNVKGMIGQYTTVLGEADINVSDMTNKAKGDYAYALIDVDSQITDDVLKKLQAIDDVLRVRVVK